MLFSSQIQFSSIHRKSDTYLSWLKHSFQQFIMRAIYSLILGPYWSQFDFHQFIAKATHSVLGWLLNTDKQQRVIHFFIWMKPWFQQFIMMAIYSLILIFAFSLTNQVFINSSQKRHIPFLVPVYFQQFIRREIYSLILWSCWSQFQFSSIHREGDT